MSQNLIYKIKLNSLTIYCSQHQEPLKILNLLDYLKNLFLIKKYQ